MAVGAWERDVVCDGAASILAGPWATGMMFLHVSLVHLHFSFPLTAKLNFWGHSECFTNAATPRTAATERFIPWNMLLELFLAEEILSCGNPGGRSVLGGMLVRADVPAAGGLDAAGVGLG